MKQSLQVLFLIFFLAGSSAFAETVYVTDQLRLNLYELPNSQGNVIKSVQSGTALEVLEREPGYAKVKTPEGAVGWAKSAYMVTEKPATLIVNSTLAQMEQMKKQYSQMKKQLEQAKIVASTSSKEAHDIRANLQTELKGFEEMKNKNRELQQLIDSFGSSVPFSVFAGSVIICLLLGFIGGWLWLDSRIRKTHGGFRIY